MKTAFHKILFYWLLFPLVLLCTPLACAARLHTPELELSRLQLPEVVLFRDNQATYNRMYAFLLYEGIVLFKRNGHLPGASGHWQVLPVPVEMGRAVAISADDEYLMVIDGQRRLFTMLKGLEEDPARFTWRRRWGFPFWWGGGIRVPDKYKIWDASFISPAEDGYLLSAQGNKYRVGQGCTTVFLLEPDGRRITYIDPWLVNDFSNAIASPLQGTFQAIDLSASGSTLFVIDRQGQMYTLLYDFDISGADDLFFNYSYNAQDYRRREEYTGILPRRIPRPLPIRGWVRQPDAPGEVSGRISISKEGQGAVARMLLVEGRVGRRTGYFTKDIRAAEWRFVETDTELQGTLPGKAPLVEPLRLEPRCHTFAAEVEIAGLPCRVEVPCFNPCFFETDLLLTTPDGSVQRFVLHYHGTIRLRRREPGLTDRPLALEGALQLPAAWPGGTTQLPLEAGRIRDFFAAEAFTEIKLQASSERLRIYRRFSFDWKLAPEAE